MASLKDLRILLVDDQRSIRDLARVALEEAGACHILEATSGEEALAMLRAETVDLVISDWNMQPLDGLELLKAMRGDAALAKTPFIMMTGKFEDEDIAAIEAAGVSSYLVKPFNAEAISEKIGQTIP